MRALLISALILYAPSALAAEPTLNCSVGPITKAFGGSSWLVYGCNDKHSVVAITATDSVAAPFFFMFAFSNGGYKLYGEGKGNKAATDAAYKDLSQLSASQIDSLFNDATRSTNLPPQVINIASESARGWLPSVKLRAQAEQLVQNFLSALDSGQDVKAYDLITEGQRKAEPFGEFAKRLSQFNAQAGPVIERQIVKITWIKEPASASAAGIYAAVDLVSRFANINRHCGYIVLYQFDERTPLLVRRREDNYMTNEEAQVIERKQSEQAVDKTWSQLARNCPNYDGQKTK